MDRKLHDTLNNVISYARTPFIFSKMTDRTLELTQGKGFYKEFTIDMSSAITERKFIFHGDRFLVTQCDSQAYVRLNSLKNDQIDLTKVELIKAPFKEFYISADGSGGTLKILVGTKGMFESFKTQNQLLPKLKSVNLSDNTQINAGANRTEVLQPDPGYIYQIIAMKIIVGDPVGSTAGSMKLYGKADYNDLAINQFYVFANTGSSITIDYSTFICSGEAPGNDDSQGQLIKGGMWASYEHPFGFYFDNQTDANLTTTRYIKLIVKEYLERI